MQEYMSAIVRADKRNGIGAKSRWRNVWQLNAVIDNHGLWEGEEIKNSEHAFSYRAKLSDKKAIWVQLESVIAFSGYRALLFYLLPTPSRFYPKLYYTFEMRTPTGIKQQITRKGSTSASPI